MTQAVCFFHLLVISNKFLFGHRVENLLDQGSCVGATEEVKMPLRWVERSLKFRVLRHHRNDSQ